MSEPLCACGCGEPALFAARHVRQSVRTGSRLMAYEITDTGYETPCHIWTGKRGGSRDGTPRYGKIYHAGRVATAHRVIYELQRGPVPEGMQLHHLCGQSFCVNPDHLQAFTPREHVRHHGAKLDPELIRYVRKARKNGAIIARELGISRSLVSQIRRRHIWTDVD